MKLTYHVDIELAHYQSNYSPKSTSIHKNQITYNQLKKELYCQCYKGIISWNNDKGKIKVVVIIDIIQ